MPLATFGRTGTGGLYSVPARGGRSPAPILSPGARSKTGIMPSNNAALRAQAQITVRPRQTPAALRQTTTMAPRASALFSRGARQIALSAVEASRCQLPALSAVYRWLEQNDLDAHGRRYLLRQNIPGPTKTFEAPGVNDLWIVDFSPGPFLALHPKTVATHCA